MSTQSIAGLSRGAPDCLTGGGVMGSLMRAHDWAATPLGPVEYWPQSLRTSVSTCLNSRFAILIWWGRELVMLYNDAYREIIGSKHPAALGMPGRRCFPEIWRIIGPMLEKVMTLGEATRSDDLPLYLERYGYAEECYFTFSYSPIRDETGGVGGVFTPVAETTEKIIGARRLHTLQQLASRTRAGKDAKSVCAIAAQVLSGNLKDVPFSGAYLHNQESNRAELVARSGADPGDSTLPALLPTDFDITAPNPGGAIVLPLSTGQHSSAGFLLAGVSPHKQLDETYRSFFELIAGQIAASIADARAYQEERKRAEALAELDRAKTQFFSNISHEFRTPLTLMLAPLEDLLRAGAPEHRREELALIHRNGLRLLKLVNTLLDFSRLEAGRARANYEPTDLAAFTADIASCFRSAIEKAGLRYHVDCPPLDEPAFIDREMWENIVLNLLSNALKFTLSGEIDVSLRRCGERAELTVKDTGLGISKEEAPRLFQRFHRIEGRQGRTHEGSGIGLAFVHELVKLHGGEIRVDSAPGEGSAFTVSILLGSAHLPAGRIQTRTEPRDAGSLRLGYVEEALRWTPDEHSIGGSDPTQQPTLDVGQPTILVVEDNADMRDYLRRTLETRYQVVMAPDGEAALAELRAHPCDLVLSDVMMPRLDGFALVQRIRHNPATSALPAILLSARAGEDSGIDGLRAGADAYLVKPFSTRDLLARVESQLSIAQLRIATAQKERELRERAELERSRWHNLIKNAPAGIALLRGPELIFELVNDQYVRSTGRAETAQFEGKRFREALPELVEQGHVELLEHVYRSGQSVFARRRRMLLNPSADPSRRKERFFNSTFQPVRGDTGEVEGVFIHAVDVTEEVIAERRLEESEAQFRNLADSIPNLAWIADPTGARQWFNRQWYDYTGFEEAETTGWGWLDAYDPERVEAVMDKYKRHFEKGEFWEDTVKLRARSGEYRWFLSRAIPIRNSEGRPVRWFGTSTDVTFEIEAQQRLSEAQRLESVGLLAGGIAHDFNNLLVPILGYATMARDMLASESPVQPFFAEIETACERAANLTKQLLAYAGKTRFVVAYVDVGAIVREAVALVSTTIPKNVIVVTETAPSLPSVEADPAAVQQIVVNLLLNAAEAIGNDHGTVTLRVGFTEIADPSTAGFAIAGDVKPGGHISVEVHDTGCGMDDGTQAKIFEPFFSTKFLGRGLGMAAVAGIIRTHEWGLKFHSTPGEGSTFQVLLRAIAVPAQTVRRVQIPDDLSGSGRVLVVDDEAIVRRTARLALERYGYRVLVAESGDEAVRIYKNASEAIDLVLLDLSMPGMGGQETLAALLEIDRNVKALVSSGYSEQQALELFSGQPTVGFIQKPYTPPRLAASIKKALEKSRN